MSILERTIAIVFEGDDRSSAAFGSVSKGLNEIEGAVQSVTGPMAQLADDILKTEAAMAVLAAGGLALSIVKAGEFNAATAEIGTLITDTTFDIDQYRSAILAYAASSTQSIADINSALYSAVSAGIAWEDSIEAVASAERLAVAGKAELKDATVLLSSTMNAYGASMDEATRYSDVLFQTVRLGQTTLPELAQSMSQVTSIAAAAGVPIETVAAAIADLTAKGMPTAEALTALRATIAAIIDPSDGAAKAAAALGIEFNASALASKGLESVLMDVYKATGGNVEQVSALFGNVRSLTGVLALFGQDGGNAFLAKLTEMALAGGSVSLAYAAMVQQIENQNQALINSMMTTFIKVGQPLLDEYGELVKSLASMFQGLNIAIDDGAFAPVFEALKKLGTELAVYIDDIAKVLPEALSQIDWGGFINSLEGIKDSAITLFKAIFPEDLTTADGLAQAIQKIINAWETLNKTTSGILEAWNPIFTAIGRLIEEFGKTDGAFSKFAENIGNLLGNAQILDALIEKFGLVGSMIATAMIDALGGTAQPLKDFGDAMHGTTYGMDETRTKGEQLVDAFGKLGTAAGAVEEKTTSMKQSIHDWATAAAQSATGIDKTLLETIARLTAGSSEAAASTQELSSELKGVPANTNVEITPIGFNEARQLITQMGIDLTNVPTDLIIELGMASNEAEFQAVKQKILDVATDQDVGVVPTIDEPALETTKKKLDTIPPKKEVKIDPMLEIESIRGVERQIDALADPLKNMPASIDTDNIDIQLERVKGQFELMQTSIEWTAKLNIAEFEADAARVVAVAGMIGDAWQSSADVMSSAIDALASYDSTFAPGYGNMLDLAKQEMKIREELLKLTQDLTKTQIDYMKAKIDAMQSGDALIKIDGDGLAPHLEAFMWEVLSAIQVRVNEEGHEMLFGV